MKDWRGTIPVQSVEKARIHNEQRVADVGATPVEVPNFLPSARQGFRTCVEMEGDGILGKVLRPLLAVIGLRPRIPEDEGIEPHRIPQRIVGFVAHHFPVEVQNGIVVKSRFIGTKSVGIRDKKTAQRPKQWTQVNPDFQEKNAICHGILELKVDERLASTRSGHEKHDEATGDVAQVAQHRLSLVGLSHLWKPRGPFNEEGSEEGKCENPSF